MLTSLSNVYNTVSGAISNTGTRVKEAAIAGRENLQGPQYLINTDTNIEGLNIRARYFKGENTVVLDTITNTNTNATLNFNKGKLLAPGT
jgi:hypothetical protein